MPLSNVFDYKKLNKESIIKNVRKIVQKLRFKDPILWVYFHPYQYDYYGLFDEKITVTDWYDKYTAPTGNDINGKALEQILNRENQILSFKNQIKKNVFYI